MDSGIIKKGIYIVGFILTFLVGLLVINALNTENKASNEAISFKNASIFNENFSGGYLNPQTWQITSDGDFNEYTVDVHNVNSSNVDYRLRLGMNTIGTRDDKVKFLGVKSVKKVNISDRTEISFDIDWNNQSNGCYMSGSFYLCPSSTNGNPENENNWLKLEYIGVPPGQNARCEIANKIDGNIRLLYTDGWPVERTGRKISDQHVKITLDKKNLKVLENGRKLNTSNPNDLNITSVFIYLQMSSHSNYPMREIYFDNIAVTKLT